MKGTAATSALLVTCFLASAALSISPRVAHAVFSSPVNGGCYLAATNQCRVHIDPVTVNIATGESLELVQVQLNGITVYDYRTDVSNPPPRSGTTYIFSPVGLDFAAMGGKSYTINVVGKDTGDVYPLNMGQTGQFTCPAGK